MESNNPIAKFFITSKPVNLYGYTIIVIISTMLFGVLAHYLKPGGISQAGVALIAPSMILLYLFFPLRFYISRNNKELKEKILYESDPNKGLKLVLGGKVWGISFALLVLASTVLAVQSVF